MTLPDQGTPVGHHDVTTSNTTPTGPAAAAPDAVDYGSSGIAGSMFTGFMPPQTAPHLTHQPVYSPMAGYAIQDNAAAWMTAHQDMHLEQPAQSSDLGIQQHQQHQGNRPAGLASANWLSHFPSQIPAGPSTPSIASGTSYILSPGYTANSPSLAGTPSTEHAYVQDQPYQSNTQTTQLAQDQGLHLENSSGAAMQNSYGFMTSPDHQMMSMAAAINTQQQQIQAMPQQAMNIASSQLSATPMDPVPAWLASHNQSFYYTQFGYGNARDPSIAYMEALPASANGPFSRAMQQPPMNISGMSDSNDTTDIGHSQIIQQLQQQQQQQQPPPLPPSFSRPATSFTHPIEDETPNEERRKFVRTNCGTSDAYVSRRSSVKVHGYGHGRRMAAATTAMTSDSTTLAHAQDWNSKTHLQVRAGYFSPSQETYGFRESEHSTRLQEATGSSLPKIPDTPKDELQALPVVSAEMNMSDATSVVGESEAGGDVDAMCFSPFRNRSLSVSVSVACSDEWNETVKTATTKEATPKPLATVPENGQLEPDIGDESPTSQDEEMKTTAKARETPVPIPAATPMPSPPPVPRSGDHPPNETQPQAQQLSTGKQEMQFIHMDAAEILMSSHSFFPDDHESGAPIKPVKFRPAGNVPIKVRKWSTVVHPPPPESGYGSMPREVDFDHSASNVFLQHQASPVAPSSVTSSFKAAPSSSGKGKAKQDGSGSPSSKPLRTLNWRPSDDRISTASAGLPPKAASKTSAKFTRLEEKTKAAAAEEAKAAKNADLELPDAEAEADQPMSVAKALAALSSKRGRPVRTARVARTKQVRKRTEESASKPNLKAAEDAKEAKKTGNLASAS